MAEAAVADGDAEGDATDADAGEGRLWGELEATNSADREALRLSSNLMLLHKVFQSKSRVGSIGCPSRKHAITTST